MSCHLMSAVNICQPYKNQVRSRWLTIADIPNHACTVLPSRTWRLSSCAARCRSYIVNVDDCGICLMVVTNPMLCWMVEHAFFFTPPPREVFPMLCHHKPAPFDRFKRKYPAMKRGAILCIAQRAQAAWLLKTFISLICILQLLHSLFKRIFVPIKLHSKVWVSPLPMAGASLPHWVQLPWICFSEGYFKNIKSIRIPLASLARDVSNFSNGEIRKNIKKHLF